MTGITVRYIYSACIVTTTPDVRILHDPWFSEGVYDGSWYHYPKIADPIAAIGDVDLIYVSHIHPDHYDGAFLKAYFQAYGVKPVLIAGHTPNHLAGKMRGEGLQATIVDTPMEMGNTTIAIVPHKTGSASDIDSAIILKYRASDRVHCVVNANDIIFDATMRQRLKAAAGDVDILLCGYTGAGPYPQTYFDLDDPQLLIEGDKKKRAFFDRYRALTDEIEARVNIPFAGQYILGGRLAPLNAFRGVADPVEVTAFDPRAVVLADNGGEIDTASLVPTRTRTEPYDPADMAARAAALASQPMDYERLMALDEVHQLPLKRLLGIAAQRAKAKSECHSDYFFCIGLPGGAYATINANSAATTPCTFTATTDGWPEPRSEITIDPRYLFGLLTGIYHWNNAEVGSQFFSRRTPNIFNREAQAFLNFLSVI